MDCRFLAIGCALLCVQMARAEGTPDATIVVLPTPRSLLDHATDAALMRRREALQNATTTSTVYSRERAGEAMDVGRALAEMPGAVVRSTGGLGAYAMLSVRGASPGQTLVVLDGVPLSRLGVLTVDLGQFSLAEFASAQLYRNTPGVEVGAAPSALLLTSRVGRGELGERLRVSAGVGSFGYTNARVWGGEDWTSWSLSATAGRAASRGNFTYFEDNGTPLTARDDTTAERQHNAATTTDGSARLGRQDGSFVVGARGHVTAQELPGSTWQPSSATLGNQLLVLDTTWRGGDERASSDRALGMFVMGQWQQYRDRHSQIGLGAQARNYRVRAAGVTGHAAWRRELGPREQHVELTVASALRGEELRDTDLLGGQPLSGDRAEGSGGVVVSWQGARGYVSGGAHIAVLRTDGVPNRDNPAAVASGPRWELPFGPRVSALWTLHPTVAMKTSLSQSARLPTLVEAFGDRGFVVGNPNLLAEQNRVAELALVWAPQDTIWSDQVLVEGAAFTRSTDNTIALTAISGVVARAENIGQSTATGVELSAASRFWKHLRVAGNYTFLATRVQHPDPSYANKAIPRQPRHQWTASAAVEGTLWRRAATTWLRGTGQSDAFLDAANLRRVPGGTLFDMGLKLECLRDTVVTLHVNNLADTRVVYLPLDPAPAPNLSVVPAALSDVAGFPLPGRTVFVNLEWSYR